MMPRFWVICHSHVFFYRQLNPAEFCLFEVPSISRNTLGLQSFFSKSRVRGFLLHQTLGGRRMAACFLHTATATAAGHCEHFQALCAMACHRTQAHTPCWHHKVPPGAGEQAAGCPQIALHPAEGHDKNRLIFVITMLHWDKFLY